MSTGRRRLPATSFSPKRRAARVVLPVLIVSMLLLALATLVAARPWQGAAAGKPPPRPNVVFILVDTLRADRLGCYGYKGGLSPAIDELARESVLFERPIATGPWTLPSVASYLTGFYPGVHGVIGIQHVGGPRTREDAKLKVLDESFATLAEMLKANGYVTAGFSANPLVAEKNGFAQGFDHYDASFARNDTPGSVVNAAALKWLQSRDANRPFFLYLHYMDVHGPYKADDRHVEPLIAAVRRLPSKRRVVQFTPLLRQSTVGYSKRAEHRELFPYVEYWCARYEAGISQVDQYLGELFGELRRRGLWDEAYVIFAGDHGEALAEHEELAGKVPMWGHGETNHHNQLHTALLLRWPGHLPGGKRVADTVSLMDLFPTVLDHLGIAPDAALQARSLRPLIEGGSADLRPVFGEAVKKRPQKMAVVDGRWKLMGDIETNEWQLFDLEVDPLERDDLSERMPQRRADLVELISRQHDENKRLAEGTTAGDVDLTADEIERLRALGYIDDGDSGPPDEATAPDP